MGLETPDQPDIEYGVGRYGLRTFKPAIVRGEPYLVSVSQEAIPHNNQRYAVKKEWRELLTDSHPISWADGTCTAVCTKAAISNDGGQTREPHDPPVKNCSCGIYALDDLRDLYLEYGTDASALVAVISASGRTFEHRKGIKTQHARVVAYWVLDHPLECGCALCGKLRTSSIDGSHNITASGPETTDYGFRLCRGGNISAAYFPWVECCEKQFINADRWEEPDAMAEYYDLKATPLTAARSKPPDRFVIKAADFDTAMTEMSNKILGHKPGTPAHYEFEITYDGT